MKNQRLVKMLAWLIANMFLVVAINGNMNASANPSVDESKLNSAQTHDTYQFSYFENQKSEDRLASPDRDLEITVYDSANNQTVPDINITVTWVTGQGSWFGGDIAVGVVVGIIVVSIILAILTFGVSAAVEGTIAAGTAALGAAKWGIVGGAILGGAVGGFAAWRQGNVGGTVEYLKTDAYGKVYTKKAWQDNVEILVDLDAETEIAGYAGFKPQGQPHWFPVHPDTNIQTRNRMTVDIKLVKAGGMGSLLGNMKIAQGKVGNLTYVDTEDLEHYEDGDANIEPIDMHIQANADNYAEECDHPEWSDTDFWRCRVSIYPDGKGSDVLWIESKRLFYVKDASGISNLYLNTTYEDGNGVVMAQGSPAGAIGLNDKSNLVVIDDFATGKYVYYQWVWVVGMADLTEPTVTIKATVLKDSTNIEAGWEEIQIPDERHIITFTFSDSSLIGSVHHSVYADRSIPTVNADLQYNFYSMGNVIRVKTSGIQTTPEVWNTGAYGEVDLTYPNCGYPSTYDQGYPMYFAVEDNSGDVVTTTTPSDIVYDYEKMTVFSADIATVNITPEQSYRLALYNGYFGAEMSQSLFYQLTDWDGHYNLSLELEKVLNQTFALTGSGEYGYFNPSNVGIIQSKIEAMNDKIKIHKERLDQFIRDKGESDYTKKCADMIMKFEFFYEHMSPYLSMSASAIASKSDDFAKFRALSYALLYTFNHAYLYYSCSVAFANGDTELAVDLDEMMQFENNLIDQYYNALGGGKTMDLTLLMIIIIAAIIASIVTYASYRIYMTRFHAPPDQKKLALIFGGIWGGTFAISFCIMFFIFWNTMHSWFGHIPKL